MQGGDGLFEEAGRSQSMGAYDRALNQYHEFVSNHPNSPYASSALIEMARIYRNKGDNNSARTLYKRILQQYPESRHAEEAVSGILMTHMVQGHYDTVRAEAQKILGTPYGKTHAARVYMIIGESYMASSSPINAIFYYTRAINHLEKTSQTDFRQSTETGREIYGKIQSAIPGLSRNEIITLLQRLENREVRGYLLFRLGQMNYEENRTDDAITVLSKFIELYPGHKAGEKAKAILDQVDTLTINARYSIGCLLPMTGKYEAYGQKAFRGIEMALNRYGESDISPVNIILKDTASDTDTALSALKELQNQGVSCIIGPIATAEPCASLAQHMRIPIILLTQKENITDTGDYVFRNFITSRMQVDAIVTYAIDVLGMTRFGILYPKEDYGERYLRLFWEIVNKRGGQIVDEESYEPGVTDFTTPIQRLNKTFGHNDVEPRIRFDALFIPDESRIVGLILPQLAFHDVSGVQLLGTNLWHSQSLIDMAGPYLEGAIFPDGFFPKSSTYIVSDFVRDFSVNYGKEPDFMEAVAYDTTKLVLDIMVKEEFTTRREFKNALQNVKEFSGVTGPITVLSTGEFEKHLTLIQIREKKFTELLPAYRGYISREN